MIKVFNAAMDPLMKQEIKILTNKYGCIEVFKTPKFIQKDLFTTPTKGKPPSKNLQIAMNSLKTFIYENTDGALEKAITVVKIKDKNIRYEMVRWLDSKNIITLYPILNDGEIADYAEYF